MHIYLTHPAKLITTRSLYHFCLISPEKQMGFVCGIGYLTLKVESIWYLQF